MSSANCLNLDQSKILSSGNGLSVNKRQNLRQVKTERIHTLQTKCGSNYWYFC